MLLMKIGLAFAAFAGGVSATGAHSRKEKVRAAHGSLRSSRNLQDINDIPYPTRYGPGDNLYQAESLDYFRQMGELVYEGYNGWFEWMNPDEIAAGATTCGFLYPDLGLLPNVSYPIISVYVCMTFARVQPASKGNLFVHCGGPGSLSSCAPFMIRNGYFSDKNLDEYNILSIDQRGMGRSWPSFAHEECSLNRFVRDEDGYIVRIDKREEDQALNDVTGLEIEDVIKLELQKYKTRNTECWGVEDFTWNTNQTDGTVKEFHFLEHSGTRALAQDVWVMRHLLNAPKIHLYGVSYGTSVFSTYATIFPSTTGLLILDSNTSPNPDHLHNAVTTAVGVNDRINYVLYSCSASGECPVADVRECIGDINAMLRNVGFDVGAGASGTSNALVAIFNFRERAEELCAFAEAGDLDGFNELYNELLSRPTLTASKQSKQADIVETSMSQPTSGDNVFENPEYSIINSGLQISIQMVRAQDRAGAIYDEDFFAKEVVAFGNKYTGAGTGTPRGRFYGEYAIGFYWPRSIPIPPAGNPEQGGIIIGLLYDSATPYVWAQEMRGAFPYTHLLTSQATNHGLGGDDYECQQHVTQYLESGSVGFVDGQVCGADFASFGDLLQAFNLNAE